MKFQVVLFASVFAFSNASPLEPIMVQVRSNLPVSRSLVSRDNEQCNCTGTKPGPLPSSAPYICLDSRLGPIDLPRYLPLSSELSSYNRLGGLTPGEFIKQWTYRENGSYIYPPPEESHGFALDPRKNPINGNATLDVGTLVDRFGGETGQYVSAADTPYSQRSLPPYNLNNNATSGFPNNYHVYRVIRQLPVVAGPIRPWFGQPGWGTQFYLGDKVTIISLMNSTPPNSPYLERVDSEALVATRRQKGCGY